MREGREGREVELFYDFANAKCITISIAGKIFRMRRQIGIYLYEKERRP